MEIPHDLKIKYLAQGAVFKAQLKENNDSYPRFYFVLNINPKEDAVVVLCTSTTNFYSHQNCHNGDDIHISLSPDDYEGFTKNCLICCGRPVVLGSDDFIDQLKNQNYHLCKPLPQKILERIFEGISKSRTISSKHKKLILGEPDSL